ncbi:MULTISPECIES: hypothetical protein [Clostridia]|nr:MULTISPECIES: hypothetical protein [Clostridia]
MKHRRTWLPSGAPNRGQYERMHGHHERKGRLFVLCKAAMGSPFIARKC